MSKRRNFLHILLDFVNCLMIRQVPTPMNKQQASPTLMAAADLPSIVSALPYPVALVEESGQVIAVSTAWASLTGLKADKWLGKSWQQHLTLQPRVITSGGGSPQPEAVFVISHGSAQGKVLWLDKRAVPGKPMIWVTANLEKQTPEVSQVLESEQQMNQLLREVVRSYPNGTISVLDQDLRFLFIDGQTLVRFNIDGQAMVGQKLIDIIDKEEYNMVAPYYRRALAGESVEFEHVYRERVFLFSCIPLLGFGRRPEGLIIVNRDITEQKESERRIRELNNKLEERVKARSQQLTESNRRYRMLYHEAPHMMVSIDRGSGTIREVNRAFASRLGFQPEELIGQCLVNWMDNDGQILWREAMNTFETSGGFPRWEFGFVSRYGEKVLLESFVNELPPESGKERGDLNTVWTDQTEFKRAMEELQESEFRFRMLAKTVPVKIWMTNSSGERTFFNDRWKKFSGRSQEALQNGGWMDMVHPDDLHAFRAQFATAIENRVSMELEYRIRHRSGQYHWMWCRCSPRFDSHGHFLGMIGAEMDVQALKETKSMLAKASSALQSQQGGMSQLSFQLAQQVSPHLQALTDRLRRLQRDWAGIDQALVEELVELLGYADQASMQLYQVHQLTEISQQHKQAKPWLHLGQMLQLAISRKVDSWRDDHDRVHLQEVPTVRGQPLDLQQILDLIVVAITQLPVPQDGRHWQFGAMKSGPQWLWCLEAKQPPKPQDAAWGTADLPAKTIEAAQERMRQIPGNLWVDGTHTSLRIYFTLFEDGN